MLRTRFRHLLTWAGDADAALQRLTIAHMLASFVSGQIDPGDIARPVLPEPVERATAWLHARLAAEAAAPIGLDDLAGVSGVTAEHLCRVFVAATGRRPMQTVRLARLDRAVVLIARSNLPLKAVAGACGFGSAFHLSRRCSEAFGLFVGHCCNARSFTQWAVDEVSPWCPTPVDPVTTGTNGSHILCRGDTHLGFSKPRFDTPCAALLPAGERASQGDYAARVIAEHGNGMLGCGIATPAIDDD